MHNCRDCKHLERTSKEQRFWLCKLWSSKKHPSADEGYIVTHCHLQPEAPACEWFEKRQA